jgi:hypothetical protein
MPSRKIPEDHIRKAAFYIWLEEGRPEGKAEEHWEAARARLAAEAEQAPKTKARARKAAAGGTPGSRAKAAPKGDKSPAKTSRAKAKTPNKTSKKTKTDT